MQINNSQPSFGMAVNVKSGLPAEMKKAVVRNFSKLEKIAGEDTLTIGHEHGEDILNAKFITRFSLKPETIAEKIKAALHLNPSEIATSKSFSLLSEDTSMLGEKLLTTAEEAKSQSIEFVQRESQRAADTIKPNKAVQKHAQQTSDVLRSLPD